MRSTLSIDNFSFGLGLRPVHYPYILEHLPPVDWFEIITENFLVPGGKPWHYLDLIRAHYPLVMHGVSLSIGSTDPLNWDYLKQLKALAEKVQPAWVSDHLCWTGVLSKNMHDLLPLPYTEEAIRHVAERIKQVQDYLERQILIENVSSYVTFMDDVMPEWTFLSEIAAEADCHILLDVNNIFVSSFNHGFDPTQYIDAMPVNRVKQCHLAGHTNEGDYIIDTHDHPVIDDVWALYDYAVARLGPIPTMIERDDHIPAFPELYAELQQAKKIARRACEVERV